MKPPKLRFSLSALNKSPQSAWITDVVILSTDQGPLHCALVLDLKTERVLGWSTALDADPTLMMRAIELACERHKRTRPTNLFLYRISESIAPDVVASLVCREFQLRYIDIPNHRLTLSMDRVWGELQRRFNQPLAKSNYQFQDDQDDLDN